MGNDVKKVAYEDNNLDDYEDVLEGSEDDLMENYDINENKISVKPVDFFCHKVISLGNVSSVILVELLNKRKLFA